jgi:hypothetical protein
MDLDPKKEAMETNLIASSRFRIAFIRALGVILNFLYRNGPRRTDFHAAFAAQALIHVHGFGFPVLHLKHADRAGIHALALAIAFAFVHGYLIHDSLFTSLYGFRLFPAQVC